MINREPSALMDLFNHVISGRANIEEIDALIHYLNEQKAILATKEKREYGKHLSALYERNRRIEYLESQRYLTKAEQGELEQLKAEKEAGE